MTFSFGGATREPYSVAQHSVLVMRRVRKTSGVILAALLHDAHEAYIGDVTSPVQQAAELARGGFGGFGMLARRLGAVIAARFGVDDALFGAGEVELADRELLATEKRDLLEPEPRQWPELPEPLPWDLRPWGWANAKPTQNDKPHRTTLNSGDVTLLAGPSRAWWHSIERIIEAPLLSPLRTRGRISITMRVAG